MFQIVFIFYWAPRQVYFINIFPYPHPLSHILFDYLSDVDDFGHTSIENFLKGIVLILTCVSFFDESGRQTDEGFFEVLSIYYSYLVLIDHENGLISLLR